MPTLSIAFFPKFLCASSLVHCTWGLCFVFWFLFDLNMASFLAYFVYHIPRIPVVSFLFISVIPAFRPFFWFLWQPLDFCFSSCDTVCFHLYRLVVFAFALFSFPLSRLVSPLLVLCLHPSLLFAPALPFLLPVLQVTIRLYLCLYSVSFSCCLFLFHLFSPFIR